MLGKSLVAGTVLTLLAGGVVYYGTDADTQGIAKADNHRAENTDVNTQDVKTDIAVENEASEKELKSADHTIDTKDHEHPHTNEHDVMMPKTADEVMAEAKTKTPEITTPLTREVVEHDPALEENLIEEMPKQEMIKTDAVTPETTQESRSSEPQEQAKDAVIVETETADTHTEHAKPSTRKWIDQYLKSDKKDVAPLTDVAEAENVVKDKAEHTEDMEDMSPKKDMSAPNEAVDKQLSDLIHEMEKSEFTDADIQEAEAKGFETRLKDIENIWATHDTSDINSSEAEKNHDIKVTQDDDGSTTTTQTETIDLGDGKRMKIIKVKRMDEKSPELLEKKIRIKVLKDEESKDLTETESSAPEITQEAYKDEALKIRKELHSSKDHNVKSQDIQGIQKPDISKTVNIIMAEAEKISLPELRDQAYLDIVTYALDNHNGTVAKQAMTKIEQTELRDKARKFMALCLARHGKAEKAFKLIEEVETESQRDVMRLQVIEALTESKMKKRHKRHRQ